MKSYMILFIYNLILINASLPTWNFESSSIDLLASDSSYEYELYNSYSYTLTKVITKTNNKINSKNICTFSENGYTVSQEVAFENIESTYYQQLGANRLVCPRGKFHPYNLETNEYIIPDGFVEEGNWDLSCYKHDTGYFLVFYMNNGDYSLYFKKGTNSFQRGWGVSFDFFAYKLPDYQNYDHNYAYKLPSIRESDGNLIVSGYNLIMNDNENAINGREDNGKTVLTKMKSNSRASIDNNYYFYYFTYNNVSDFSSGYSNTYLDLSQSKYSNSFSATKNEDSSPLSFVDNVEIID